ncbi:MAG: response regulator [Ferruginibacter sp.]|nr:response regulator [Ferruginibacter sp.]
MERDRSILLVDDDSRNIFALTAVLKARGYVVIPATDMRHAFNLLRDNPDIGVILLDMMMPEMDGYEALKLLRQDAMYKGLPVIAVTAQAMSGDREKCLSAGADDYLSKPVDVDALLELLQKI